jgi:hypothetical protein
MPSLLATHAQNEPLHLLKLPFNSNSFLLHFNIVYIHWFIALDHQTIVVDLVMFGREQASLQKKMK